MIRRIIRDKERKELDKKFIELARKVKEREKKSSKPVTTRSLEILLAAKFSALAARLELTFAKKVDLYELASKSDIRKLDEKLDWLIGAYKKFEEEQTLLSHRVSEDGERLEVIEQRIGITA